MAALTFHFLRETKRETYDGGPPCDGQRNGCLWRHSVQMPPMKFYMHVVHPRRNGKLGITRGWPFDDTGAMMAAASMEAVIKKMPTKWGQ